MEDGGWHDPEVEALIKAIGDKTGEARNDVVARAVRQLAGAKAPEGEKALSEADRAKRLERLKAIANRTRNLPVLDDRQPDDIIGYDENGLPS
ncbi:MAG: type II toxin-antitoxin system VapB family antitoxin [Pseudomonadota bacterium]